MKTCFYRKETAGDDNAKICPNAVKALIVAAICRIPVWGIIGGLIGGLALMRNKDSEDYKTFGKAILILSAALVILNIYIYILELILFEILMTIKFLR